MNTIETSGGQNLIMTDRSKLEMTGVEDVESFTDNSVILLSTLGNVSVEGEELKIESFSSDTGRLVIYGKIDGFYYFGREKKKRGLFRRGGD